MKKTNLTNKNKPKSKKTSSKKRHKHVDKPVPVVNHLDELRSRLLICLLVIIVFTAISFYFSEQVFNYFISSYSSKFKNFSLNIFSLTEGFTLRLKSSLIISLILSLPVITYQIWRFIKPAVEISDRNFYRILLLVAILLFYAGLSFSFLILLPFAISFLLQFTPVNMINTINASNYFNFAFMFCILMGTVFEIPIIISILTKMGIITPAFLVSKRKYAIVLLWIVAALITPPDILTQSIIAIPLMFLYEISIVICKLIYRKK